MKQLQTMLKPYYSEWQTKPDITAVLKYIEDTTYWNIKYSWDNIEVFNADCEFWTYVWTLFLKPLHLYTEEEEKDLLEHLEKLK